MTSHIEAAITQMLPHLDDPSREGLVNTPKRYAKFLAEFLEPQELKMTVFKSEGYEEMIIQSAIPFYSLCEHHLIPFFGTGTIAYLPGKKIVGLSKLARTLNFYSHRLQNQERITLQVAEHISNTVNPKGVGVILKARHLCMEMRGVQKPAETTTSYLSGKFKADPATRGEFLRFTK